MCTDLNIIILLLSTGVCTSIDLCFLLQTNWPKDYYSAASLWESADVLTENRIILQLSY